MMASPGVRKAGGVLDLADGCDAERARHDRDMRGRPAFFQHDAAQPLTVVFEQRRRTHRARHDDRVLGQPVARRRIVLTEQLVHQAVRQLVEVVQALAQIGVGRAQHAGARIGLHALDRGLGGEAGADRLVEPMHPAAVIGEHAVGFEHVAVLTAVRDLAALQQQVEAGAHRLDRGLEPLDLLGHVVGDEVGDDHARLVQHHMPERDALVERRAGEMDRAAGGGLGRAGARDRGELARGDHLGEHHRGGLQRLFFFLRIGAPRPVLHHQHAERVAGPQDRHAQERVIVFLAGLRPVGEGRVVLGLREVDRVRLAGDEADEALVLAQHGLVHRLLLEALGGVKLERAVHAQHVDRADLRHHVGGDQHHDLVQAILRADRLRHHLAKPAQQHAWTAERATHRRDPSGSLRPEP